MQDKAKEIVDARDYTRAVRYDQHPEPGEYVITGMQAGNIHGQYGWEYYIGYVVQVRKKAGAFGSDMVLLRHPDGTLKRHENQSYYRMDEYWLKNAKSLFPDGMTPDEYEDYSQAYTIGDGKYPEIGKIIEAKDDGPPRDNSPMVMITVTNPDGSKTVEIV